MFTYTTRFIDGLVHYTDDFIIQPASHLADHTCTTFTPLNYHDRWLWVDWVGDGRDATMEETIRYQFWTMVEPKSVVVLQGDLYNIFHDLLSNNIQYRNLHLVGRGEKTWKVEIATFQIEQALELEGVLYATT